VRDGDGSAHHHVHDRGHHVHRAPHHHDGVDHLDHHVDHHVDHRGGHHLDGSGDG
jgi:hypothetical protein